jgi:hypothetical protein
LEAGRNIFAKRFGNLSDSEWTDRLIKSAEERQLDGVAFPRMPDAALQSRIHGAQNDRAIREACDFYSLVRAHAAGLASDAYYLDFGSGWGRILRDFELSRIFGYEPNSWFCQVARSLNPYVCFINGPRLPDGFLSRTRFGLVTSFSVFSHLAEFCAKAWLAEFSEILRPGGVLCFTTFGLRFLAHLEKQASVLAAGEQVHTHVRSILVTGIDIAQCRSRFCAGEFVWVRSMDSDLYGEAFIPEASLRSLIAELPLELIYHNATALSQDFFILRRH